MRHAKLQPHTVDFARLGKLPPVDDVYIALGTTIKVAGSREAFRAVDHDAVLAVASAARAAGATRLGVVSAMGADAGSRIFYNRVKGETEQALRHCGFASLVIARPSMLAGDRAALGQQGRAGESLGLKLMTALRPLIPGDYKAIGAHDVARALVDAVMAGAAGTRVLLSGEMQPVR